MISLIASRIRFCYPWPFNVPNTQSCHAKMMRMRYERNLMTESMRRKKGKTMLENKTNNYSNIILQFLEHVCFQSSISIFSMRCLCNQLKWPQDIIVSSSSKVFCFDQRRKKREQKHRSQLLLYLAYARHSSLNNQNKYTNAIKILWSGFLFSIAFWSNLHSKQHNDGQE